MIREPKPWFENIGKRQVKTSKIYFRNSGILHYLLGIHDYGALLTHPKLGSSWEGFALEEVIRHHEADAQECYFWAKHSTGEIDLLIVQEGIRLGFEFKYKDSPILTSSMEMASEELKLDALTVIHPREKHCLLKTHISSKHKDYIRACGLHQYLGSLPLQGKAPSL